MSVNKHRPHVFVLPEDDANRQLAIGFCLDPCVKLTRIRVLEVAGGWNKVLDDFDSNHIREMDKNPSRYMILLIDFDTDRNRLDYVKSRIPQSLAERVFVLGALTNPEDLKANFHESYEDIGLAMARDCHEGTNTTWGHGLLQHNANELDRLREHVRPILLPAI